MKKQQKKQEKYYYWSIIICNRVLKLFKDGRLKKLKKGIKKSIDSCYKINKKGYKMDD